MFSAQSMSKVGSGVVIGGLLGGSYGLLRGLLSSPGHIEKLDPRPKCFDMDPNVGKLFFDISKYRYVDENAFRESLHNMDALFCLEKQLQFGEAEPKLSDPPSATQMALRALTHLRSMRDKIAEDAMYEELGQLINQLQSISEAHLHKIQLLCSNV